LGDRIGVLLVQLGGPERREELRPFLYELFSDPEILGFPAPLRQAVALLLASLRAPTAAKTYERIGWSPIRRWSRLQAGLLERELLAQGQPAAVRVGMTCSEPTGEGALAELKEAGVSRLVVLPLYPQYSVTTTKGSFDRVTRALARSGWRPKRLDAPGAWHDEPHFIAAHADRIRAAAATLPDADAGRTVLLYSAHSLPVATVEKKKDPYPRQIADTVDAIDAALGRRYRSRLGYQSKVGPVAWLTPSTGDVLKELAAEGVRQVVVVPVAFVSDRVETLYECRILYGEEAARLGVPHYVVTEGLNDHPEFIRALAAVVSRRLAEA
jgi:protoporphyrin/coproporphyrin ferrochelatase